MLDDDLGILAGDARDECVEPVPEREGVAGMQAAVHELVEARERERVQLHELANSREVEQPVPLD